MAHRAVHLVGQLTLVDVFSLLAADEEGRQRLIAREAANMCGEDTVAAEDHLF
jgi:hypothetical protein